MRNILTIDVEEYFHPSEVQRFVAPGEWDRLPSRAEGQVSRILELLDRHSVSATFFVVGWLAERHPALVRAMVAAGHEIGCHSYAHGLVYEMDRRGFREDTQRATDAIAEACGIRPRLYRAPSYSITRQSLWALEILAELGFTHDSSIYPIAHDRYGIPGFTRKAQVMNTPAGEIVEVPGATVRLSGDRIAPIGGGAYLRLLPYCYTAAGIRRLNREEQQPACIYFHPWEVDPGLPRIGTGTIARLRTYTGLRGMQGKLDRLLREFEFTTLSNVYPAPDAGAVTARPAARASAYASQ